jgi:hypothetical protein
MSVPIETNPTHKSAIPKAAIKMYVVLWNRLFVKITTRTQTLIPMMRIVSGIKQICFIFS